MIEATTSLMVRWSAPRIAAKADRLRGERQELVVVTLPLVEVALEPAVGGVHAHEHARSLDPLPERVELLERERTPAAVVVGYGGGPDQDGAGAVFDHPVELTQGLVEDGQRDDRRREDAALEVEGPVLVHPLVESVNDRVRRLRVVGEPFLDQAGQGRPHHGPVDAELVHEDDAVLGVEEGGDRGDVLGRRRQLDVAFAGPCLRRRVLQLELQLLGTWRGDDIEDGVGDVLADLVLQRDLGPAIDLHVLDHALVALRQVLREGLGRLVHVVVGVEDQVVDLAGHRHSPTEGTPGTTRTLARPNLTVSRSGRRACRDRSTVPGAEVVVQQPLLRQEDRRCS